MVTQTQTQRMLTHFINVSIAIDTMLNFEGDANAGIIKCEPAFSSRLLRTTANRICLGTDKSINIQSVHGYPHTQQLKWLNLKLYRPSELIWTFRAIEANEEQQEWYQNPQN